MKYKKSILVKVCGMRDTANILEVAALQPDYMGFIFYEPSPRFVGHAFKIPNGFPASVKRVGVFVNETVEKIQERIEQYKLDYVQLHGDESVVYCAELKKKGTGVIKVFRVDQDFDFSVTEQYVSGVDYFLFDTKGKHYGGNAARFDWALLQNYQSNIPFFLSGGISVEHRAEVEQLPHSYLHALDVNSGVEYEPGMKDVGKVKMLIENLRN